MSGAITEQQALGFRLGGYFVVLVAILSSINWLLIVQHDYVTEHKWPGASGTVIQRREDSREVTPPSIRQRRYSVYWAEFTVSLDVPLDQCPGEMWHPVGRQSQCIGVVKTPEVKSRSLAIQWLIRHPSGSRIVVHYDRNSGDMAMGGESVLDIYPWDKIGTTAILLGIGALMILFGRAVRESDAARIH